MRIETQRQLDLIYEKYGSLQNCYNLYNSLRRIEEVEGVTRETFRRYLADENYHNTKTTVIEDEKETVKLARKVQFQMDRNRIERRDHRDITRSINSIELMTQELIKVIEDNEYLTTKFREPKQKQQGKGVGVLQLSDLHFNEQVDLDGGNKYNWKIASARLRKHIHDSIRQFKAFNVSKVIVAMTGDMFNSDRRPDEQACNATSRTRALYIGADIMLKALEELHYNGFDVTVTFVTGNESRVDEKIAQVKRLTDNNYDVALFLCLRQICKLACPKIEFFEPADNTEDVINVGGKNFLLIHGHLGMSTNIDKSIDSYIAKWLRKGKIIHYVIFGHIHQALISDRFARSGSTVGDNDYSFKTINTSGEPSQNCYIVYNDNIYSIKNPLNVTDETYEGYEYDVELETYNSKSKMKALGKKMFLTVTV